MAQIKAPVAGNSRPIAKTGNEEMGHFGRRASTHDSFGGPILGGDAAVAQQRVDPGFSAAEGHEQFHGVL
jgi:hypothetical protein